MEDVPRVYARDFDDGTVLVRMDGTPEQRTRETRTPLATRPGQPAAYGFEYERNGTANLFMVHAPLDAWRHAGVTDRRRRRDFAWLPVDMAETGINVLSRQCLDRRIPDRGTMVREVAAWQRHRNGSAKPAGWRSGTGDARIRLKSLYPTIQ